MNRLSVFRGMGQVDLVKGVAVSQMTRSVESQNCRTSDELHEDGRGEKG